ncbi:MAG: alternative ribosome rescue aminoacyl-tRNA hydrolase ArfB [Cellulophaga sp.]
MISAIVLQELQFKATRSSGAGGQHVNKVSSKIELFFDIPKSSGLTENEKERLYKKLVSKLTKESVLLLQCSETRSQHKNKEIVIKKFFKLLKESLTVPKKRKKTKPSRSAIERRLQSKKRAALKKTNRGKPSLE